MSSYLSSQANFADRDFADRSVTEASAAHILFVEDEVLIRMYFADLLRDQGFVVFEARDAEQARSIFGREEIDLLISDVRLPGIDGLALARELTETHPHLRVFIASSEKENENGPRVWNAWLTKPCDPQRLVAMVRELLTGDVKELLTGDDVRGTEPRAGAASATSERRRSERRGMRVRGARRRVHPARRAVRRSRGAASHQSRRRMRQAHAGRTGIGQIRPRAASKRRPKAPFDR